MAYPNMYPGHVFIKFVSVFCKLQKGNTKWARPLLQIDTHTGHTTYGPENRRITDGWAIRNR